MNQPRYKIVFDGELMPEMTLESVKDNLARLFKSDLAKIESLFNGAQIALKRDLQADEADQYLNALQRAGAKVRKELEQSSSLSLIPTDDHPEPGAETAVDDTPMTCPKCGHEQRKSSACSACGIIIEKFLARQAQLAAEPPAPAPAAVPVSTPENSPYAPPQANVAEPLPEFAELKTFSLKGRIGRVRYLGWSMALLLCSAPIFLLATGVAALSSSLSLVLIIAVSLAITAVAVCIGVQRLHDLGWSGWLWLLNFVPLVGSVFALLMLILPGSQGVNRFGPPPPPNSRKVTILAWLIILVPIIAILAAIAIPQYQQYVERAASMQGR